MAFMALFLGNDSPLRISDIGKRTHKSSKMRASIGYISLGLYAG